MEQPYPYTKVDFKNNIDTAKTERTTEFIKKIDEFKKTSNVWRIKWISRTMSCFLDKSSCG